MQHLSPDRLLQTALGFRAAQVLLCAVRVGLFSELARGPRSARQLRGALALNERAVPDLLDALVAMGMLDREGDDMRAVYLNTREAGHYLDRRSVAYLGAALEAASARDHRAWGELAAALRAPALPTSAAPASIANPDAHAFEALADRVDLSTCRRLAWVGNAGDQLAAMLAQRHPLLRSTRVDARMALPAADVIVLVGELGSRRLDAKLDLIRRAHAALPGGGRLIAIEPLIDDARRHNLFALLESLDALLRTGDGFGFSGADFDRWCLAAGFRQTESITLGATCSAAVARK